MNIVIHGARCAVGPEETIEASIEVTAGRITRIGNQPARCLRAKSDCERIDLSGLLVMPGLVNAHDHLQFSLFPRLANPTYRNYVEWGEGIHSLFPELIALHKAVPRNVRLRWGGIRNLLCGVTTVCHHDPLWPELLRNDFPVRVVQQFGWAHSPALGGDLRAARAATPAGRPFILHCCEGVDEQSRMELWQIDRMGLLDADTVLVHALALDSVGAALLRQRKTSVVLCPSSNQFLFGTVPDIGLLSGIDLALGSDSPLTAASELLDEVHFATRNGRISHTDAYRMVTERPAAMLRLHDAEGSITESGAADLIAVCDTGDSPADRLVDLSARNVELVIIHGRVQLASTAMLKRLPASEKDGLEPLSINGTTRWLRAPVSRMLENAEEVLGKGNVWLDRRAISVPEERIAYAC